MNDVRDGCFVSAWWELDPGRLMNKLDEQDHDQITHQEEHKFWMVLYFRLVNRFDALEQGAL